MPDDRYRKFKQKDCPACLDLCWKDEQEVEHIAFNICQTHLQMGREENERDFKEPVDPKWNKLDDIEEDEEDDT